MPWINSLRDSRLNFISSNIPKSLVLISCIQSLSHVWLSTIPWTAACQAFLSFTISRSFIKRMSIELVMPCKHLILCHPIQSFPASESFLMSWDFISGGQSIGDWASVLSMNIQDWFPLGLTGLISLQSKWLSWVFSKTTVQKHQFVGAHPSS